MKKLFSFLFFLITCTISTQAFSQFSHTLYGNPLLLPLYPGGIKVALGNEVGLYVRSTYDDQGNIDGGAIIAGYRTKLSGNGEGDIVGGHYIVMRVDKSNNILWEQPYGFGLIDDDIITDVIVNKNNETIICGTFGRSSFYVGNNPMILKIDGNGNWIGQYMFDGTTGAVPVGTPPTHYQLVNNPNGIAHKGLCELDNGNIVIVGSYNFGPNIGDGFITVLDPALNLIDHEIISLRGQNNSDNESDGFEDVVEDPQNLNSVFIVGSRAIGQTNNQVITITSCTPPTTFLSSPIINWTRQYHPIYTFNGANMRIFSPDDIFIANNPNGGFDLIISSFSFNIPGHLTSWMQQVITRVGNINSANPPVLSDFRSKYVVNEIVVNNITYPLRYCNTSALAPHSYHTTTTDITVSNNDFFIAQSPGDGYFFPEFVGDNINNISTGVVTRISDFDNNVISYSVSPFRHANRNKIAILDLENHDNKVYMVGYQNSDANPIFSGPGGLDIYYGEYLGTPITNIGDCSFSTEQVGIINIDDHELITETTIWNLDYMDVDDIYDEGYDIATQMQFLCGQEDLKPGKTTSILNNNNSVKVISVYPNPVVNSLNLSLSSNGNEFANVSICDITGKALIKRTEQLGKGENIVELSMRNLSSGMYILKVQVGEKSYIQKISKE